MSIQTDFRALLVGAAIAGGRVYPQMAPDSAPAPYIVYSRIGVARENEMAGNGGAGVLKNTMLQVDIYSPIYGEVQSIAEAIAGALQGWSIQNTIEREEDLSELEAGLHRVSMDISTWHY